MAIRLQGGCRVSDSREGEPEIYGTLLLWKQIGRRSGAVAVSLRTLEFRPGLSPGIRNPDCDEILYAVEGSAAIFINGRRYDVDRETGIYLRPWDILTVENHGPASFVVISSQCPEPQSEIELVDPLTFPNVSEPRAVATGSAKPPANLVDPLTDPKVSEPRAVATGAAKSDSTGPNLSEPRAVAPGAATRVQTPIVGLSDRNAIPTSDRWYRVLVDDEVGSTQVTQFVGSIPPGRAPDHYHDYEEVLVILLGQGRMWAGESSTPIEPGSCVYLPKGQVHCVENTGSGELRLLGVFCPAGSPGARTGSQNPER